MLNSKQTKIPTARPMPYALLSLLTLGAVLTWATTSSSGIAREAGEPTGQQMLPVTQDLLLTASQAKTRQVPILLMFAARGCEYCERLEDDHLFPMTLNANTRSRVLIRKVMIDSYQSITDFDGKPVQAEEFAYRRGVQVTPTVQFIDAQGNELVPKLIGYQAGTFYGAYLDQAIDQAGHRIKGSVSKLD